MWGLSQSAIPRDLRQGLWCLARTPRRQWTLLCLADRPLSLRWLPWDCRRLFRPAGSRHRPLRPARYPVELRVCL